MKFIMVGNPYQGYKRAESIRDYAIYFPANISPEYLESWRDNAKHGDMLEFESNRIQSLTYHKQAFLCVEIKN